MEYSTTLNLLCTYFIIGESSTQTMPMAAEVGTHSLLVVFFLVWIRNRRFKLKHGIISTIIHPRVVPRLVCVVRRSRSRVAGVLVFSVPRNSGFA